MILLDHYPLPPGQCSICGSAATPVVDTLIERDTGRYDHRLYVCGQCVQHMGGMTGMVPASVAAAQSAQIEELIARAQMAEADLEKAKTAISLLQGIGFTDLVVSSDLHVCEKCGDEFASRAALGQHKRTHAPKETV